MGQGTGDTTGEAVEARLDRGQRWSKVTSGMAPPVVGALDAALAGRQAKVGNVRSFARAAMNAPAWR